MSKLITGSIVLGLFFSFSLPATVQAQTMEELQAQIQQLLEQVQSLQAQLGVAQEENTQLREALRIERQLDRGDEGEDVETLQEILATDPSVYPEGLVTGYFGPLTERAVQKFQGKFGISQVGRVGPQTMEHINYILENGAGNSGVVPPGLLMKFKGQSIFESLPEQAKERCKAVGNIPGGVVPFGIFAECDTTEAESEDEEVEIEEEETEVEEEEVENESEDE